MKRRFLRFTGALSVAVALLLGTGNVSAQQIALDNAAKTELSITQEKSNRMSFVNNLESVYLRKVNTSKREFVSLEVPGYVTSSEVGHPELPMKSMLIEIPLGATPTVKIMNFDVKEIQLADHNCNSQILPAQPSLSKSEDFQDFKFNEQAYQKDEFAKRDLVEVEVLGIMRGVRLALVKVYPFRYNPVKNSLKVFENLEFDLNIEGGDVKATQDLKARTASPYFNSLANKMVANSKDHENMTKYPVKYVIVADRMFEEPLQPFIEWKTKKGFNVVVGYTDMPEVGDTKAKIKAYIKGLYDAGTAQDPAPSFVLFVGDVQQIPAYESGGNGETDRFYCEYTNDFFPEIYYGRFSVQSKAQCEAIVEKTLMYEQYTMPDPSYLDNVLLVSGVDENMAYKYGNGAIRYYTENYVNEEAGFDAEVHLYPESASAHNEIIAAVSNGVTFSNYTAHCSPDGWADPEFSRSNVNQLTNEGKYGFMIGNCCSSSEFAQNECFSEKITRTPKKGCWGYIGGSNSSYWSEDYYWGVGLGVISSYPPSYDETDLGVYDRAFHTHDESFEEWYVTAGQIIVAGNLAVTSSSSSLKQYYWDIYNVVGDPSAMIYLGMPEAIEVTLPTSINMGANSLELDACPYAYVGASHNGVLYGAALADENGHVELELNNIDFVGNLDIVITAQNKQPYTGVVNSMAVDGAYVVIEKATINDSEGNSNGTVEFDETISLDIKLGNFGNATAENLVLTATTDNDKVIIEEGTINWDNIAPEGSAAKEGVLKFKFKENIEDQQDVVLHMNITNGDKSWDYDYSFTMNAPVLMLTEEIGLEIIGGNDDNMIDPGETVKVTTYVSNEGSCSIQSLAATVTSLNPNLTVVEGSASVPFVLADQKVGMTFKVKAGESSVSGDLLKFKVKVNKGSIALSKPYQICVGLFTEDFETGNFETMQWEISGDANWEIKEGGPEGSNYYASVHMTGNNKNAYLTTNYVVTAKSTISFDFKTSTETGYDKLKFFVNETFKKEWSGVKGWEKVSFEVEPGEHTFKWIYFKDPMEDGNDNIVSIDNIVFPIGTIPVFVGNEELKPIVEQAKIYPNPTQSWANVVYHNESVSDVKVEVYNAMGQLVKTINQGQQSQGAHELQINFAGMNKGVYHVVVQTETDRSAMPLVVE